jgi:CNT family concentrative nucleoside transporter
MPIGLEAAELARAGLGVVALFAVVWLIAESRRGFPWRVLLVGFLTQIALALLLTKVPAIAEIFRVLAEATGQLQASAADGAQFVFGYLAGGPAPYAPTTPNPAFIFAFQTLPSILLVGALSALLWHWGVLRVAVRGSAWLFRKAFGVSGPVGVSTSACVFLGMVEAPLLIRPLIPRLSRGELFIVMVDGLSVIGGSMMIVLGGLVSQRLPGAFGHILTATLISTPMAMAIARAVVPAEMTPSDEPVALESHYTGALDAVTKGTLAAVGMAVNIAALLIVFIGGISLLNRLLAVIPTGGAPISVGGILGTALLPVTWLMGFPAADIGTTARLLGTKVALNEVVAYSQLIALPTDAVSAKSLLMITYALGSFGNIGSVAILIAALSAMAPERASEIVGLGFKALGCAFLVTCLSATVVGALYSLF